ncbi:mechanosensitive ion channel protein MscS [Pseudoxanthomonas broegbernensis]|uniref:Mechanosensitive ion channel protein MscS n=1 Tax=Pseudoxanthomonas broegbernensis TaxID=83619 RepID=A0A7V8GLH5_9GAMM|nr:DUF3772 domain-containing protein [Pseudoxanthomonas broegbernensis]KAF1685860.1 mechanosensitive ion channel protein MscS [Pseudoxanthomonas broegbernensis]MBB6064075.1 small-conductance mechanosensitive channel [Pseudoxanthomonas broegbernensis]
MRRFRPPRPILALLFAVASAWPAMAQDDSVEQGRRELEMIAAQLDRGADDAALAGGREAALKIQARAQHLIDTRAAELESLDARLAELGEGPAAGGTEAAEVTSERAALQSQRSALDAQLRQARLSVIESGQLLDRIAGARQQRFHDTLSARTTPPWRARFWQDLRASAPRDRVRLHVLGGEARQAVAAHWAAHPARAGLAAVLALLAGLGAWLGRGWVHKWVSGHVPAGPLRRSAPAVARLLLAVLATALVATLLRGALLPASAAPRVDALAAQALGLSVLAAFVTGLGAVLLAVSRPSWRLPAISDVGARTLRPYPLLAALAIAVSILAQKIGAHANASLPLTVAITALGAVLTTGVVLAAMLGIQRLQRHALQSAAGDQGDDPADPGTLHFRPWMNAAVALGWVGVSVCVLGLLTGYVALSAFVAMQLLWTVVVVATAWLAMRFIDDLVCALLASRGAAGRRINVRFGIEAQRVDQAAVVLSMALRTGVALLALIVLVAPYGTSGGDLIGRALELARGVTVGELVLSPRSIGRALLVFVLASGVLHLFRRWLARRYLPTTKMDEGMRASVVALIGYAGTVLAVAMALAAIGVGLERIAWIASALSVGIGFGLQAIVQNFISGLILLAERPVKVGDWVVVGDAEGDIRRINVRATEIQTGDRTTVLVPNSEFITKTVRNRTYSNAEGLVKVVLPMPLAVDADMVRGLLLEAFREHPGILDAPAPSVLIDGIDNGRVVFSATGFVATPRLAASTRSALLFEILRRMRRLNIRML